MLFVIFLNLWQPVPVYHEYIDAVWSKERETTLWHTRCGLIRPYAFLTAIPRRHAAQFGRPCIRCYKVE